MIRPKEEKVGPGQLQLASQLRLLGVSARYAQGRLQGLILTHGWYFLIFSFLMRLPAAMIMLTVMMMLALQQGNLALAGYGAGTVGLAAALVLPAYLALAERWGVRRSYFALTLVNILALVWLMFESLRFETQSGSVASFIAAAALAGLTTLPLGALMRRYWSQEYLAFQDRRKLNASFSLETIFDVTALPAGATIAGVSTLIFTGPTTLFVILLIDALGLLMLLWRPENLPAEEDMETRAQKARPQPKPLQGTARFLLYFPQLGSICLGLFLGATQAALLAFALSTDQMHTSGYLIGLLGFCAVLSSLFVLFAHLPMFGWAAWLMSGISLLLMSLLSSLPGSTLGMIPVLTGLGLAFGLCLVSMDSIATSLSARKNLDLALATLQASYLGGIALGLVWAAAVSESYSYQVALMIPLLAAALFLGLGHLYGFFWRQNYEESLAPLPLAERRARPKA